LASGATTSSEGTWPVCRLPLAAFSLSTSGVKPRRPAAVIQYEDQGPEAQCPAGLSVEPVTTNRVFAGPSGEAASTCHLRPSTQRSCCLAERRAASPRDLKSTARMSLCIRWRRELHRGCTAPKPALPMKYRMSPSLVLQAHHSRMLHMLACLPLLPGLSGQGPLPTVSWCSEAPVCRRPFIWSLRERQLWLFSELTTWLTIG